MIEPWTVRTLSISTATAEGAQNALVRDALRSQRERLPALLRSFAPDEWTAPSRCAAWSVHEVVRHVCDATIKTTALLRGELPEETAHFDPRTTPVTWLERSANERPHDTVHVFEDLSAQLLNEVDRHVRDGTQARLPFLYGDVPWSIAALHSFWDAWVHERDVVLPLGHPYGTPPIESRAAAAYGLVLAGLVAGMPQGVRGGEWNESVVLTGEGGGTFRLEPGDHTMTVTLDDGDASDSSGEPLRGALAKVVDSLVGRGPELIEVLRGPSTAVELLGALRAFMLLPTV